MKTILVAAFAIALGSTSVALAQAASDFVAVDTDASGDVSLAEAQVIWADLTAGAYVAADANADGKVDEAEYATFLAANPPA
jgi:hypothetical protein